MTERIAQFNRFEVTLSQDDVNAIAVSGDNEAAVNEARARIDLSHISDEDLVAELNEYGAWDEDELAVRSDNEQRIIWLTALDIKEGVR